MAKTSGRRGSGEDSYYQRADGTWVASRELGYDHRGIRKRLVRKGPTKKIAMARLASAIKEQDTYGAVGDATMTLKAWMEDWLATTVRPHLAPKTIAFYATYSGPIIEHLGRVKLRDLTPAQVRAALLRIEKAQGAHPAHASHRTLRAALGRAEKDGIVPRNVAEKVDSPTLGRPDRKALTAEEGKAVLATKTTTMQRARNAMTLLTGKREGECLGLRWDHVTFGMDKNKQRTAMIDVTWQLQEVQFEHGCADKLPSKGQPGACGYKQPGSCPRREYKVPSDMDYLPIKGRFILKAPKAKASDSVIPAAPMLADALWEWRKESMRMPNPHGLVFHDDEGDPIIPRDDLAAWKASCKAAGITRPVKLHEGRNTTATLLMKLGVADKVIAQILGQAAILTTRRYQNPDMDDMVAAVSGLGKALA